ncbi:zinc finger protein 771-like [Anopheles ziemanni]|uniref:zinc finger protein 771-like n=1 Tax=Anopheles coustani TaxID=139045 RepID=UPI002657B0E8|nr:zinc finger protein 771-like [Anopheles coustani]XP_058172525.1 zinc finger protein 771-like [Anopheles ziemanni]
MSGTTETDIDSPFVKKEKCCKICGATDGPMESIFCNAEDTAMLNKIYKSTRVEVTPVCGLISPICEACHRRIDEYDEHAQPKVIEYVIKTELDDDTLDYDPLNVGNLTDPMAIEDNSEDDIDVKITYGRRPNKRKINRKAINIVKSMPQTLPTRRRPGRPPKVKLELQKPVELSTEIVMLKQEELANEQTVMEKVNRLKHRECRKTRKSLDGDSSGEGGFDSHDAKRLPHEEQESEMDEPDVTDGDERLSKDSVDSDSQDERNPTVRRKVLRSGRTATHQKGLKKKGGLPEQCEVCGKTVSYMREHMRLHRIEKQHPCPHCDRTFVQANNLKYHIRKHLGEKPYSCKQCDKQFYCEAHLKSHMRVHGPQGLFQCDVCPKSFNQECNLKKHLRVHTGEKPYSCDTCGKRFNSTSNLRNHSRLHSDERPLTCDHCSKSFVDVHHLQRHIRVHTGERPYMCHVCSHAFYCQNGLMDHLKTHIEEKFFKID